MDWVNTSERTHDMCAGHGGRWRPVRADELDAAEADGGTAPDSEHQTSELNRARRRMPKPTRAHHKPSRFSTFERHSARVHHGFITVFSFWLKIIKPHKHRDKPVLDAF